MNGTHTCCQLTEPGNCETCPEGEAICLGGSRVGPELAIGGRTLLLILYSMSQSSSMIGPPRARLQPKGRMRRCL